MTTSIYPFLIPQMYKMLKNLTHLIDIANTYSKDNKISQKILLDYRLSPTQYPFAKQVQLATDSARYCIAHLMGKEPPRFEDNENSFEDLVIRIHQTLDYLLSANPELMINLEDRKVPLPWASNRWMRADKYALEVAIPNFYFHITTAYSILRNAGLNLSKKDFLGDLEIHSF